MVRNGGDPKLRPQAIVNGLRSGNAFSTTGQLIDRLAFIACASYRGPAYRSDAKVLALAESAALNDTDIDVPGCATMGEKLVVNRGADIVVSIVVRDPSSTNYSPYSFPNPSLAQVGINQSLNAPVLDHIDLIRGLVTGYKTPDSADYRGTWPSDWINNPNLNNVPAGAKNTTAEILATFNSATWTTVSGNPEFKTMTFRIPAVTGSQYVRLRGTNLPPSVPWETDANGNPLADLATNSAAVNPTRPNGTDGFPANYFLKIPCTATGSNVPANDTLYPAGSALIDGCPEHLPTVTNLQGIPGYPSGYTGKMVAYDVAAWADLWFYSNPIYVQVNGATIVAGVK